MRQTAIRYIWSEGQERQFVDGGFEALRDSCLDKWESSLATHQPRIALAAIHGFKHLSLSNLWQRHGLSTASAALNGSMAVGSAHIKSGWQDIAHNPGSVAGHSTLAASSVPPAHLHTGIYRQSNFLPARKVSVFKHPKSPHVLMRLFTA